MIPNFSLIGESINDSVPSTHALFEAGDMDGIRALAQFQAERSAYIDVNVGTRGADFLAEVVKMVQDAVDLPLSIDTPDPEMAEAALKVYDPSRGMPILNSISPLRTEMFDLFKICPFRPILLITEHRMNGEDIACHTVEETFDAAQFMLQKAHEAGIPTTDCIFDPGVAPIGTDTEDNFKRLYQTMQKMHADPEFAGFHASVGLSNFTVMLPPRRANGELVKTPLESAFLTLTNPLGMDYCIGSVRRNYEILPEDHDALVCLRDCLGLEGYDVLTRVMEFCM